MSWWRLSRIALGWLVVAGSLGQSGPASAFTLLGSNDSALRVEAARVVVAAHDERSTVWVQWLARATGSGVVAVVPLRAGSRLDPADPDWFRAIEAATAPRILPPPRAEIPECDQGAELHDTTSVAAAEVAHPGSVTWLADSASLAAFGRDAGLQEEDMPSFEDDDTIEAFVAVEYPVPEGVPFLVGLRLDEATPIEAWAARLASLGSRELVPVTLTVLAESPVVFAGREVMYPEALSPVWRPASGDSNYVEARAAYFDAEPEAWITEGMGQTQLYASYFPDALVEVPSVVTGFRERLEARGHDCPDWSAWLDDARVDDTRAPVGCGPGTLGATGSVPCDSVEAPNAPLGCGEVDDLELALSGARLNDVVLTRHVGRLPLSTTLAAASDGQIQEHTVKVYADRTANCDGETPPEEHEGSGGSDSSEATSAGGAGGSAGTSGSTSSPIATSGGWEGNSSSGIGGGDWYGPVERREDDDPEPVVVVEVRTESCSCTDTSSSSSEDSCSGSSSSDSGDATCSGDSSSDHEGDDATCSGDSSGSDSGDTCSGSSSGDAEGATCSGGSEGGDATCSGSTGGDGCAVGRFGLPRPRLSVLTVLLGAGLLPLRRRYRRPR